MVIMSLKFSIEILLSVARFESELIILYNRLRVSLGGVG